MPLSTGRRPRSQVRGVGLRDRRVMLEVRHVLVKVSNEECLIGVLQVVALVGLQVRVLLGRILAVSLPMPDLAAVAAASSFLKLGDGYRVRTRSKWPVPERSSIMSCVVLKVHDALLKLIDLLLVLVVLLDVIILDVHGVPRTPRGS